MFNTTQQEHKEAMQEIMSPLVNGVRQGKYTPFDAIIMPDDRRDYAEYFKKNFEFGVNELKTGGILSLDTEFVASTCWVGRGEDTPKAPADYTPFGVRFFMPRRISIPSAQSDYAQKLADAIKHSKINTVKIPAAYTTNNITVWETTQSERDTIMGALPATVKKFSIDDGEGGFTNNDLQNLTNLMTRVPNIEVHLCFSTWGGTDTYGPFDDKTYENFVKAAQKSDGIYLEYSGFAKNPLFFNQAGLFVVPRKKLLEDCVGATARPTQFGFAFDKNYMAKKMALKRIAQGHSENYL